ncbi:CAP domain-containing protein [Variovorax guangxiensis]|uniref:CAP domain-containing protein n=1 Tax=Variovorax guangxiensis TaxID=1775474 RepID=A0A502E2U5_9BURK|nr:CAP domain-containing protein [Variovorax guangxiensis]RZI67853.1 MAG: CAP domain-containing protein [Variovorax sp.]TPG27103.1 CAP domain-containing protein [Variovorax ginsengisoli]TPG30831.1 CAP domain-containing protein [Variovorax guangxiensis]
MVPSVLTALLATGLVACGGGGGGGGDSAANGGAAAPDAPATSVSAAPAATSDVPASTYAEGSDTLAAWAYLQRARIQCGFGAIAQNAQLDAASRAHANYLIVESTGTTPIAGHGEPNVNNPFFTGNAPSDRALQAGYGPDVVEILSASIEVYGPNTRRAQPTSTVRGESAMRSLLNSVAHLSAAVSGARVIGIGAQTSSQDERSTNTLTVNHRLGALLGMAEGTQLLGAGKVATYPCAGSVDIDYAFAPATEAPNPFPEITDRRVEVGPPIYLRADVGATLAVTSRSLKDAAGVEQALRTAVGPIAAHEFFMVPASKLAPGATYTVNIAGSANGVAFDRSFSFKTRS